MKSNPCSPPLTSASRADSRDHTTGSIGIVSSTAEDRTADTRTSIDDTGSQVASVVPVSTSRAKSHSAATDDVDQSVSPCTSSAGSSASPAPIRQTMIDAVAPSSTHPSVHVSKHDSTDTKDLCAVPSIVAAEELSPRPSHQHHEIPQYRVLSASSEHEEVEAEVQAIDHTATRDLQNGPRSRSTSESPPQRPSSTTSGVVVARCARGNLHAVTPFGRPVDVEGNVDRKTLTPSPMPEGGPTAAPTARDGATHRPTAQQPQSYMQPTVHAHAPKVNGGKSSPSPGIHTSRSHTPVSDMEGGARIQNPEPHPQTQTVPRSVTEYLMLGSGEGGHRTTPAPVPTTTTTTAAAAARLVSGMGPSLRTETTAPSTAKIYHYKSLAYNKAQLDQEVRDLREELAHVIGKGIPHGPTYHPSSISGGSSKVVPQHTTLKTGEGKMISTGVITFPVSSSSLGDQEANVVPSTGLIQNEHEGRPEEDGLGGSVVDAERSDASLVPSRSLALDAQARLRLGEYERQVEQEVLRREQLKEELKREQQLVLALQTRVQENAEKEQHVLSLRCEEAVLRESLLRSKKVLGPGKRIFASDVPGHKDVNAEIESLSTQFETLRILTEADRAEAAVRRLDRDVVVEQSKLEGLRNEIEDLSQKTRNSGESSKSPRTLERFTRAMTARGTSPSSGLPIPVEVTELLGQISQLEQELSRGDAQAFTAQLHAQKQQLEEIRRKYDTEDEALERECAEVQEIIRNITGTEDDIIILRQQLTNELRALELAINAKTVRVDGCVHPEECRGQHVAYFMELSNRVHEVLSEWVKIQQETSNLIEDATMRGIATTARGPFAGCKDKTAMLLSQYEKDAAHLRALIKALELRREELRREAAATRAQQVQCSAEKSPRNPQENKYGRTKSFGK